MIQIIIQTTCNNEVDPAQVESVLIAGGEIQTKHTNGTVIGRNNGKDYYSDDEIKINGVTLPLSANGLYNCTVTVNIQ